MPKWTPKENGGPPKPPLSLEVTHKISESRCHVCQHKHRDAIDRLLAMHTRYIDIERLFSTDEQKLDARSVSKHAKLHLNYDDAAIRQIVEYEAQQSDENLSEGIRGAFSRRVYLDVALKKALDSIIDGEMVVEPKDAVKIIELREKLDKDTDSAAREELWVQFNAFKQAVLQICPPEMKWEILELTKQILDQRPATPALQAPDQ